MTIRNIFLEVLCICFLGWKLFFSDYQPFLEEQKYPEEILKFQNDYFE